MKINTKTLHEKILFSSIVLRDSHANIWATPILHYRPTLCTTAEMQKDKTIMIGGSMIDHHIYSSSYWSPAESMERRLVEAMDTANCIGCQQSG